MSLAVATRKIRLGVSCSQKRNWPKTRRPVSLLLSVEAHLPPEDLAWPVEQPLLPAVERF